MIISVSNSCSQKAPVGRKTDIDQERVQKVVLDAIEKTGLSSDIIQWNGDGHLELKHTNSLKLHTLTLEMEKLGLDLKLTKQTLIEIQ